jgi:hypothetical protein
MGSAAVEYLDYYDLENRLFPKIRRKFLASGELSARDLWCILIWKANRAKNLARVRLIEKSRDRTFCGAVSEMASRLHRAADGKERLQILMTYYGFRLPTATAIASVLYPSDFTIYDKRVCDVLSEPPVSRGFHRLGSREFTEDLWSKYQEFVRTVKSNTPPGYSLRDRDRYLWGKSLYEQIEREIG